MAIPVDAGDFTFFQNGGQESGQEPTDGISLGQILATLWRRRWVFGSVVAGLAVLGFIVVKLLTPTFTATSILILSQRPDNVVSMTPGYLETPPADSVVRSQADALQSRTLVDRIIDLEDLMDDPEFNYYARPFQPNLLTRLGIAQHMPSFLQPYVLSRPLDPSLLTPAQLKYNVATQVLKALDVEPDARTYTVKINFTSVDSQKAANIANAFANQYLKSQMDDQAKYSDYAAQWLDQHIGDLSKKVQETGAAVAQFRAAHHIIDYPSTVAGQPEADTLALQQVQGLEQSLEEARANTANLEAAQKELQQLASNPNRALSAPTVANAAVVENVREQEVTAEAHLAELRGTYGSQHPLVLQAQGAVTALRQRLREEVQVAVHQLDSQLAQARGNEDRLQAQLDQLTQARENEANLLPRLQQLEADQSAAITLYNTFAQGYYHAAAQDGVPTAQGRIVQFADPVDWPTFPNMLIFMAVIIVAAGMVGVATVFVLEARDQSFHTVKPLELQTGLPVLGMTLEAPHERFNFRRVTSKLPVSMQMLLQPNSSLSETVRLVRTAITFSHAAQSPKVVMVTSAVPGEGKTTFSMMMARLSAVAGKRVLIIEAEMRRPSFARELNDEMPAKGLTEYLQGDASFEDVVGIDKASGAHFIAVRRPYKFSAELLATPRMVELLDLARQRYDLIVLDTPPASIVSDAVALGHGHAIDAAVLLVKWGSTPAYLVQDAVRKLRAANVPLVGTVLTQVSIKHYASFGEGQLPYHYAKNYYSAA